MSEVKFLQDHTVFSTKEFAFLCKCSMSTASRKLSRLEGLDVLVRVTRGIWCQPSRRDFTPNQALGLLLGNERGYISFLSALHVHGAISQIPTAIQIATTGHGRVLATPIGRFEFFQINPRLVRSGFDMSATRPPYLLASGEKALLDTFYISTRKGRRFSSLPELDVSAFDRKRLSELFQAQRYSTSISSAIKERLEQHLPRMSKRHWNSQETYRPTNE